MPSKSSIHTDKWHRCLGHVSGRKGGGKYNKYAVCTSSLGRSGTFKKSFRNRKAAEMRSLDHEFDAILRESARGDFEEAFDGYPVLEVNNCHGPGRGHPCVGGAGGGEPTQMKLKLGPGRAGGKPRAWGGASTGTDTGSGSLLSVKTKDTGSGALTSPKAAKHKVEYVDTGKGSGPYHVANYRGMEIHTLPSYTTPYYYVNAPGFGSMEHSPSFGRIKNQINRFKDTGQTARGHHKAKASERYQKQKRAAQIRSHVRATL
jgi:hypothetical protein